MNRTELIGKISEHRSSGEARGGVGVGVGSLYAIKSAVREGDTVRITGFGTFKGRDRAARQRPQPTDGSACSYQGVEGHRLLGRARR